MLNFAEQTGSGAVMLVWSYPPFIGFRLNLNNRFATIINSIRKLSASLPGSSNTREGSLVQHNKGSNIIKLG
jgi:hypothetical protein